MAGHLAVALAAAVTAGPVRGWRAVATWTLAGAYAATVCSAALRARSDPTPANLQRYVGAGILGVIPLDAALLARSAPPLVTAAVAAAWPLARRLTRRRSPT
jgi:4-hydroxybenzoate polyprenyltransferase